MPKRWYIVHAYSNFENKVADSIREKAAAQGLDHLIDEVLVPKDTVPPAGMVTSVGGAVMIPSGGVEVKGVSRMKCASDGTPALSRRKSM